MFWGKIILALFLCFPLFAQWRTIYEPPFNRSVSVDVLITYGSIFVYGGVYHYPPPVVYYPQPPVIIYYPYSTRWTHYPSTQIRYSLPPLTNRQGGFTNYNYRGARR